MENNKIFKKSKKIFKELYQDFDNITQEKFNKILNETENIILYGIVLYLGYPDEISPPSEKQLDKILEFIKYNNSSKCL